MLGLGLYFDDNLPLTLLLSIAQMFLVKVSSLGVILTFFTAGGPSAPRANVLPRITFMGTKAEVRVMRRARKRRTFIFLQKRGGGA